ncbi:dipeptidyl aminopeptidase [Usnea florida]
MTMAERFTPEVLLSAPRRSAATPNSAGTLAVYTASTYSFESHKKISEIKVLDISSRIDSLITNAEGASEPNWLGSGNELLWLEPGEKGQTQLVVGNADEIGTSYIVGSVPAAISDVKLKVLDASRISIVFSAKANPDGSLYKKEDEPKKYSTGMLYESIMVRHWDHYVQPQRNALWHGTLRRQKPHITGVTGEYSLGKLTNVLSGSGLESPIPPFGGKDHFDVSVKGIGFVAKDPGLNPATNTKCNFYYIAIDTSGEESRYSEPKKYGVDGIEGASSSPVLSPDGNKTAFLQMKENGYESDKNRILLSDLTTSSTAIEILASTDGKGLWDKSPGSVAWSSDGKTLLLLAEDTGTSRLFKLDAPVHEQDKLELPVPLTPQAGHIDDVQTLGADPSHLFVSGSNLVDNSFYSKLDTSGSAEAKVISSNSRNGSFFGLSHDQVSEIWFQGAREKVHAWVMKPSNFSSTHRYPLAYLIHGGPQGAWTDQWSTRWNPAVFAEQGYVVVAPNPTGSTGYGQPFTDAIRESWGGLPYQDLVNGFEYIKESMDYVDTDRAVALGASYGGYMMNWMQGHSLGKEFKALVCHDGVFSITNQLASDEQYFPNHDLGGPYFTAYQDEWEKWNPARFTANWSTPMFVIHNELDYRLPISEGLAAFNVLQEQGIKSKFLTFPDENHWVLKEENSLQWHLEVINWINSFVGLPPHESEKAQRLEVQN